MLKLRWHNQPVIVAVASVLSLAGAASTAAGATADAGREPRVLERFASFDPHQGFLSDQVRYVAWQPSATRLVTLDASSGARQTFEITAGYRLAAVGAGVVVWEQGTTFVTGDIATGSVAAPVTRADACGDMYGSDSGIGSVSATRVVAGCSYAKAGGAAYGFDRSTGQRDAAPIAPADVCPTIQAAPPYTAGAGSMSDDGDPLFHSVYAAPHAAISYSGADRRVPRLVVRTCDSTRRLVLQRDGQVGLVRLAKHYVAWSSASSLRAPSRVKLYDVLGRKLLVRQSFKAGTVRNLQLVGQRLFVRTEARGKSTILSLRAR